MVEQGRAPFRDLTFRIEVGPIREGDCIAGRWIREGLYAGGLPGATATPGTPVVFRGSDVFRLRNGKITEFWASPDGVHLMAQLGMLSGKHQLNPTPPPNACRCRIDTCEHLSQTERHRPAAVVMHEECAFNA